MTQPIRPFDEVTWGDRLRLKAPATRGATDAILSVFGPFIGKRVTFAKLYRFDEAPTEPEWQLRAWALLTAYGIDAVEWGIPDSVLPPALHADELRELLRKATERYADFAGAA